MVLTVSQLQVEYQYDETYEVVDIDSIEEWAANTPFHDLPRVRMTLKQSLCTDEVP